MTKVLILHVPYQHRGGEDVHVDLLERAYRRIGVEPVLIPADRRPPAGLLGAAAGLLGAAAGSLAPGAACAAVERAWNEVRASGPAYIHAHNAFPLYGPRFFRWARARGVPVAMTVHNHRFYCTNGVALRAGRVCKSCLPGGSAWRPLLHNCNGSWAKTAYHAAALGQMRAGAWGAGGLLARAVRVFVAPSPYIREELIRFGVPAGQVRHVLNPIEGAGAAASDEEVPELDFFYAGRLSSEKGVDTLLKLAGILARETPSLRFGIAGDGPERARVEAAAARTPNLTYFGRVSGDRAARLVARARTGILASICNEILPTSVLECFFAGKPCVIAETESTRWLGRGGFPGILFRSGDAADAARAVREALAVNAPDPEVVGRLREKLGMDRFCRELVDLARDMIAPAPGARVGREWKEADVTV